MNIIEYLNSNTFYSLPEVLDLHHSNPFGFHPVVELIAILVVVAVMGFFNHKIRYYGKKEYYPVLYTLLAISTVMIYYYCFQEGLPSIEPNNPEARSCIGWFCHPDAVGIVWAVVGIAGIMVVIYNMLIAIMQATAEMTVQAKLTDGKPWKEWKWAVYIALLSVAACGFSHKGTHQAITWTLIITQLVLLFFVIGKMIADIVRSKKVVPSICISLVFYIGLVAVMMLTTECMRGTVFFFVGCLAIFTSAKARNKKPKGKKIEEETEEVAPAE